jgi:hypothetical protein
VADLRQLGDLGGQAGGVALQRQQPDLIEEVRGELRVDRLALGEDDLLRARGLRPLVVVEQLLVSFSPGRRPTTSMATSLPGRRPDSSIMSRARSMIFTGSPISRT